MIIKCNNCGRYEHYRYQTTNQCIYCGKNIQAQKPDNPNVPFNEIELLLSQRQFSKVISQCNYLLNDDPTNSELYWIRLLAKYQCTDDLELISKSINFQIESDKQLSYVCGNDIQKNCIFELEVSYDAINRELKNCVCQYIIEETNKIFERRNDISVDIKKYFAQLSNQIHDLTNVENELIYDESELKNNIKLCTRRIAYAYEKAYSLSLNSQHKTHITESEERQIIQAFNSLTFLSEKEIGRLQHEQPITFSNFKATLLKQKKLVNEANSSLDRLNYLKGQLLMLVTRTKQLEKIYTDLHSQKISVIPLDMITSSIGNNAHKSIISKYFCLM